RRLAVSPKMVDDYRARLMERLGLKRRSELVRFALRTGLLAGELDVGSLDSGGGARRGSVGRTRGGRAKPPGKWEEGTGQGANPSRALPASSLRSAPFPVSPDEDPPPH